MRLPESLVSAGRFRPLIKGEILFHQEGEAKGFYYLKSGEIALIKSDREGRELEIARITPGHFFGEAVCFTRSPLPAAAHVRESGEALYFPLSTLLPLIEKNPATALFLIELLAGKCIVLTSRIESLKLHSVRERIIRYLLGQCGGGQNCRILLDRKKNEIAAALGTLPETFSRTLRELQNEGLIRVEGRRLELLNCVSLRREITGDEEL